MTEEKAIKIHELTLSVSPLSGTDVFDVMSSIRKDVDKLKEFLESYEIQEGIELNWYENNAAIRITEIFPPINPNEIASYDLSEPKVVTLRTEDDILFNTILIVDISKSMNGRDLEVNKVKSAVEKIKSVFSFETLTPFLDQFKEGNNVTRKAGAIFAGLLYLSEKTRLAKGEIISIITFADKAEALNLDAKEYVITDTKSQKILNRMAKIMLEEVDEKIGMATNMANAIEKCERIINAMPKNKRKQPMMVILLTDGFDTSQKVKEAVVNLFAENENIVLHAVGLGPYVNKKELLEISRYCGGELFMPDNLGELLEWYDKRAKDLTIRLSEIQQGYR
ncbi:MAG: VWA domain-containing protein [Candidatus Heimdallarchaeota archaeon]|nr:VWA domain-containing protein [Candidatus Heimdallarchaeota archaeon]